LACIDQRLLDPGDPEAVLEGVLVALVNAVEVCLDRGDNPFATAYAEAAIRTLAKTLTPEGLEQSRAAILRALTNAAVWSACARDMAPPGLAHRLGRAIAAAVPHPAAVCMAICLPAVVARALEREPRLGAELLHLVGDPELYSLTRPELRPSKCVNLLREGWHTLCRNWSAELPADLVSTGLGREALTAIAETANPAAPQAAVAVMEQSWTVIAPQRLQALTSEAATPEPKAPPADNAGGIDHKPDGGSQDAPAELL
jgi:alcohol dehydrogenase class IV